MQLFSTVGVTPERPNGFGHVGVALATSIVALVNFLALVFLMRRRIRRINGKDILLSFFKILLASAIMSSICYFTYYLLHGIFGAGNLVHKIVETFVPIGLGGIAFFFAAKILGLSEIEKVYNLLARKLRLKK
jgi:putative peptidoglycan lipid II flippase